MPSSPLGVYKSLVVHSQGSLLLLLLQAEHIIRLALKQTANITVTSRTFKTGEDPTNTVDDLFVS